MTVALKKKADALAARLKPEERVELADLLYASLPRAYDNVIERAWEKEIDRRLDEYESGKAKAIPSHQVHTAVRRRLNEIKARRVSPRRAA
jgi:putative addiction module component (TIGR02574 family)